MTITLGTPIARPDGLTQRSFSQSAAGTADVLVADPGDGSRVILHSLVLSLSATGTALLVGLTGAFDIVTGYPQELVGKQELYQADSTELALTTTAGAAKGYIVYDIET